MSIIIIAIDFSKATANAVEYATDLATVLKAELCLLHVSRTPMIIGDLPKSMEEQEIKENAQRMLEEYKKAVHNRSAGKVLARTELRFGVINQELQSACEEINPLVFLMESPGKSGMERFFFGSHTAHAWKNLNCPLIVIPPNARFSNVRKIALAFDLERGIHILPFESIRFIVHASGADLHFIVMGKPGEFIATDAFESLLTEHGYKDLRPVYHFFSGNNSEEGLLHFIKNNQTDLLFVLPRIRERGKTWVSTSLLEKVVLRSDVPVLSIQLNTNLKL